MLRATLITLLLCLAGTAWTDEGAFETEGGNIRGPRIVEQKISTDCKSEKNWPICSDEDWGPKCPSGCRIQGLTEATSKDFGKRIDNIRKKLKEGESTFKSIDVRTKETYELIKDNLVQALESDGKYNQVSEDLRRKIDILKVRVSNQVQRVRLLQSNIRDQVVEMKRLEVDIDIKLRACKGSCAKNVDYHVDQESYDNIQKQLLQAEATDLRPGTNSLSVLKMRPIKDSTSESIYKSLPLTKGQEAQYPAFTNINQYAFVLERKGQEVNCPSGCRVQGLITKTGKAIMKQADNAMQSCVVNIFRYHENLSGIKQVYEVTRENMLKYQDAFWNFVRTGNEIQKRLTALNLKVKMQAEKIQGLLSSIEDQLAVMKRLEVDMDIKMRSCQGSCRNFHPYMVNMNDYTIWNRYLSIINISQIGQIKDLHKFNISSAQINITSLVESTPVIEGKQLDLLEDIQQQVLKLQDQNDYYNETNSVV